MTHEATTTRTRQAVGSQLREALDEMLAKGQIKGWDTTGTSYRIVDRDGREAADLTPGLAATWARAYGYVVEYGGELAREDRAGVAVGTRVAYEDAANPRREGRVVEIVPRCETLLEIPLPTSVDYVVEWDEEYRFPAAEGDDPVTGTVGDLRQPGWVFFGDRAPDRFDRYVKEGERLIAAHPDWRGDEGERESFAADNIASILHGIIGRERGEGAEARARDMLERALRAWRGDYEEMGQAPEVPGENAAEWARRTDPPQGRTILVHLNVTPSPEDDRDADAIADALGGALEVGSDDESVAGLTVEIAGAEEV